MFIKKLNMCGFKCYVQLVQIQFDRGFNIITGENGTGKTSILEALKFILDSDYAEEKTVGFWKNTSANSNAAYVQIVVEDCQFFNIKTKSFIIERNFSTLDFIKINKKKISINYFHNELKNIIFMTRPTSIITPFVLENISKSNLWNFLINLLQNKTEIFDQITEIKRSSEKALKQFQNENNILSSIIAQIVELINDYNKYVPLSKEINSLNRARHEIKKKILEDNILNTTNELNLFQSKRFNDIEKYRNIKKKIQKLKLITKYLNLTISDIIYNKIQKFTDLSLKCYNALILHINKKNTVDFIEELFANIQDIKLKINNEERKYEELTSEFNEIQMKKSEIDLYFRRDKDYKYIEALLEYSKINEIQELNKTAENDITELEISKNIMQSDLNTTLSEYDELKQKLEAIENDNTDDLEYLTSLEIPFSFYKECDENIESFFNLALENEELNIEQIKIQSEIALDEEIFDGMKSIVIIMQILSNKQDVELPADICEPIFNLVEFKSPDFTNAIMPFVLDKMPIFLTKDQKIANELLNIHRTAKFKGIVSIMSLDNFYVAKTAETRIRFHNVIPLKDIFEFNEKYITILEGIFDETVYVKNRNNIKKILKQKNCCIVNKDFSELISKEGAITSNPIVNKNKYENCIQNLRKYYNNLKKITENCNEQSSIINNLNKEHTPDQTEQLDYIYARRSFRKNNEYQRQIRWNMFNNKLKSNYLIENLNKNDNNLTYIKNKLQYTRERISNTNIIYKSDKNKYQLNEIEDIYKKYFQKLMDKNLILIKLKYFMSEIDENEYKIHENLLTLNIYEGNKILYAEKCSIYQQCYTDIENLKQESYKKINYIKPHLLIERINNYSDILSTVQHELFEITKKCNHLNGKRYNLLKQFNDLFCNYHYNNLVLSNQNHNIEENTSLAEVERNIISLKQRINEIGPVISETRFLKYSMFIRKHERFATKIQNNLMEKSLKDNLTENVIIMHDKLIIKKIKLLLPKLKKNLSNFLTPNKMQKFEVSVETNDAEIYFNDEYDKFLDNYLNINDITNIHIYKVIDQAESMDNFSFRNKCLAVLSLLLSTINEIDNFLFMFDDLDEILKQPILWNWFNAIILENQYTNNLQVFSTTKYLDSVPMNTNIIKCDVNANGMYAVKQYYKK